MTNLANSSQTTNYTSSNPYYTTDIINSSYLGVLNYRPITKLKDDVYYKITATHEYRPDLLALDLYGNSELWWVFAERNPNKLGENPYMNFTAGTEIFIPTLTTLRSDLGI